MLSRGFWLGRLLLLSSFGCRNRDFCGGALKNRCATLIWQWGGSSAGRASRSQCEGREFDPPPLHQEFQ
jgi:hypothetical protein